MSLKQMERDARNRAAMTAITGRTPPPRFRPAVIILMVLIVGVIVIGLITSILAYFPGYSAKGVNALRIAGPVVLGVGLLALGGMLFEICKRSQKEKRLMEKSFHDLTSSRMTLASRQSAHSAHSVASSNQAPVAQNARPSKSILKNASSSSTYSDSGIPGQSGSYEQDSSSTGSAQGVNYRVDMNPDPTAARNQAPRNHAPRSQPQTGYQPPVQPQQPRQAAQPGRGYGNRAYSQDQADARETDIDGDLEVNGHSTPNANRKQVAPPREKPRREMASYANQGFDVYDPAMSLTGAGLLQTSGLMETPAASPSQHEQSPRRWGQSNPNTPRSTQPPASYHAQQRDTRQQVSTVTETYQQSQSSYTPRQQTTRKYQHAAPRQAAPPSAASHTPSSSTEV